MMLPERFASTVAQHPDSPAVITNEGIYSYKQLHDLAARIASSLFQRGIGQGCRVGLHLPRGFRFVASMVGVMMSGAAYTPLDAHLPGPYVEKVLKQLSPHLVVTDTPNVMSGTGGTVLFNELLCDLSPQAGTRKSDDPVYIIFTSGSTGDPKGVVISHESLACFTDWCVEEFSKYTGLPLLNVANFSFDQSVLDIVMLLAAGCPMVCLPGNPSIMELVAAMEHNEVAFVSTVPSTFSILLSAPALLKRFPLANLQCVVLGGAAFSETTRKQLFAWKPDLAVYNLYGPTEATVYCFSHKVTARTRSAFSSVALGTPLPGMQAHVVTQEDRIIHESPAEGELIIQGNQIMTEYFHDPKNTFAAFTVNAPELRGSRVYRTGDMVHRDSYGAFYFIGRLDDLVKTSGYRVSLTAVEQAAQQHDGVVEAGAVALPDPILENRVVLCVCPDSQGTVSTTDVEEYLRETLPTYMQPGEILLLDVLPHNTSGKLDRAALKQLVSGKE